ncbi:hypothetical protein GW17_00029391 [Ensete ventricosum]|nr:hypothetical protein GW17_00029391 [Ensete ventricosum]
MSNFPVFCHIDYICNKTDCGKGTCEVSPEHAFGYVCNCKRGWTQFHIGDHFRFLPCVVPNCEFHLYLSLARAPSDLVCSLGADCANLGITLSNSTSPASPPSLSDSGSSSGGGKSKLLVLLRTENRCDETLLDLYVNRNVSSQYIAMDGCVGDSCRHGLHEIRRARSIVIVFFCPHSAYRYRWSSTIRVHSAWYLF